MKKTVVYLSTYPPYEDGIATFTHDLVSAQKQIFEPETQFKIAAIDILGYKKTDYPQEVDWVIKQQGRKNYARLAQILNRKEEVSCVCIQHEYGIFGGVMGNYLLDFLESIKKPVVITLHTVLDQPEEEMKAVTQKIIDLVGKVVVMSQHSRNHILNTYDIPEEKVVVIGHGIHPLLFTSAIDAKANKPEIADKVILGTFGFLSPGKGIEYVIRALPRVVKKYPQVEYWLMGRTHPLVQKNYGEQYRISLQDLVKKLHLESHVKFYNKYMSVDEIQEFLTITDIYIATSLNPEQTVSGTFSYALGSGRCVVSTGFAQAREFIKKGGGMLVNFRDEYGYSQALLKLIKNPLLRTRMQHRAWEMTRYMLWTNVAISYMYLFGSAPLPKLNLKHIASLTDKRGIVQFSRHNFPDQESGYTIDDNARAAIVSFSLNKTKLARKFLQLLQSAQLKDGSFKNYLNPQGEIDDTLHAWEDLEDANGRAIWALGVMAKYPQSIKMWQKWATTAHQFSHLRSQAFIVKGIAAKAGQTGTVDKALKKSLTLYMNSLLKSYYLHSHSSWKWFEPTVTYTNGTLVEAMLIGYQLLGKKTYLKVGLATLNFLLKELFKGGVYVSVGQEGWWKRGQPRSEFDQQPEEVQAMISALRLAFEITNERYYAYLARQAFYWYLGNNLLGHSVYDRATGGCRDGLESGGVNQNQGAESTLSYLLSRLDIETLPPSA